MSKGNTLENDWLQLYFNNVAMTLIGDAAGLLPSAAPGSLFVGLHTASPAEGGAQNTSEAAYPGYARVGVTRNAGGWTVATNRASNTAAVLFPQSTGGPETELFWSIGSSSVGAGKLGYYGPIGAQTPEIFTAAVNDNITIPGHSLVVDDRVVFVPIPNDVFPTGLVEGTVYWVKTSAADVITVSTTQGGATVDITVVGAGLAQKVTPLVVNNLIQPQFAAGTLKVDED